jgi:uncharacterized membrane protein YeaQ/YmgE (transglycosylase-associated protein family)
MAAKWLETLATVAPVAATMIGGPLAGVAVKALTSVFGLGGDATEAELEKAVLKMTPEQMLEAKKVDADLKKTMIQAGVDLEKIAQADRSSARELAGKTGITVQILLLVFLSAMFSACLYGMFAGHMEGLSETSKTILNMAIGSIGTMLGQVVTFFVGSTANSAQKDKLLYNSEPFNG